jgi:putative flippase GtrA
MTITPHSVLEWSRTHEGKKLIRYTAASGITTIVSLLAVSGFYGLRIISSVILATLAGNLVGMIPAYNLNRRWTWKKAGRSSFRREVVPFLAMSLLGIAFSQLGALYARHEVRLHHWSHLANTGLVVGLNLLCFAVFWVLKLIVFNRIFHVETLTMMDEHLSEEEAAS